MQVSVRRGTYAESVPAEYTQLEGMCFRHANIHNGMKILLSGVSLLRDMEQGMAAGFGQQWSTWWVAIARLLHQNHQIKLEGRSRKHPANCKYNIWICANM